VQDMILALSAVALLQDTPDLANRLTIVLSLNQYMGQELEAKVVEVEEAPLAAPPRASLASMMGLADTPKPIIEINLVRFAPCTQPASAHLPSCKHSPVAAVTRMAGEDGVQPGPVHHRAGRRENMAVVKKPPHQGERHSNGGNLPGAAGGDRQVASRATREAKILEM
jgi:hypothetical protein